MSLPSSVDVLPTTGEIVYPEELANISTIPPLSREPWAVESSREVKSEDLAGVSTIMVWEPHEMSTQMPETVGTSVPPKPATTLITVVSTLTVTYTRNVLHVTRPSLSSDLPLPATSESPSDSCNHIWPPVATDDPILTACHVSVDPSPSYPSGIRQQSYRSDTRDVPVGAICGGILGALVIGSCIWLCIWWKRMPKIQKKPMSPVENGNYGGGITNISPDGRVRFAPIMICYGDNGEMDDGSGRNIAH
ncbi:hypothetical protein P154DRAFT_535630 [Amniculicola lignicola CBS 123094]|uniref:Uncharacterized protein n=1 Tax=Amniculicola lignicola CBS 123094 TaxID=1392246 RepID=A0A6A5WBZ9_9PLEO|nr:hypothetical protein P154DRAFT_535630 [Amniculicola lignicola CBS 123094]